MDNHWGQGSRLLHESPAQAEHHFNRALHQTAHSNNLLRFVHAVNLCTARARNNPSSNILFPEILVPPRNAPLSVKLFSYEVDLIKHYNQSLNTLKHLPKKTPRLIAPTVSFLLQTILSIPVVLKLLLDLKQSVLLPVSKSPKSKSISHVCVYISQLGQTLINFLSSSSLSPNHNHVVYARRWLEAATQILDFFSAVLLMIRSASDATAASSAASTLRDLHIHLDQQPIINSDDTPTKHVDDQINTGTDKSAPLEQRGATDIGVVDTRRTRTEYLKCLSLAMNGQVEAAISAIVPYARAQFDITDNNRMSDHVVYAAAALLLQHRGDAEAMNEVKVLAERCLSRSHRTIDSLSLVARCTPRTSRSEVINCWYRIMHVKGCQRPMALWLASRAFGRNDQFRNQLQLLQLMENDMKSQHIETESGRVRIDLSDFSDKEVWKPRTVEDVIAEQTRVLFGNGILEEGLKFARTLPRYEYSLEEALGMASHGLEIRDKSACAGTRHTWWEQVGFSLARMESALRRGEIAEAKKTIGEVLKNLKSKDGLETSAEQVLRGICYYDIGVMMVCAEQTKGADKWFAASQTLLEKCALKDDYMSEEAIRISIDVTFGRCLSMWGSGRKEDAAVHWVEKRGLHGKFEMPGDNNDENDEIMEENEDGGVMTCEVVYDVDTKSLKIMDHLCMRIYRQKT